MQCACQGILPKIGQTEKCGERHTSHAAAECPFLCVETVRPHTLVTEQVELFVFVGVVSLLKYRHIIRAAFVEIPVFLRIDRINLKPDHAEILPCKFTGFADVFHIALTSALTGQNQDFLHTAVGNDFHLMLDLFHVQFHAADVVVAVESAVDTVILAVIGNVQRCEEIDGVAEVLAGFQPCFLCHLLKERFRGRGEKCLEILNGAGVMLQCSLHISSGILCRIVVIHLRHHVCTYIRFDHFHSRQVFHVVLTGRRIIFQSVLFRQSFR